MITANPRRVGLFLVAGLALLVAGVLLLGGGSLFSKKYRFVAWFEGSVNGLSTASPVKMRGIEIGRVSAIYLAAPGQTIAADSVLNRVPVVFEIDERKVGQRGVALDLGNPNRLGELIRLGLRAELKLESFVTGQQYVGLDFRPGTPVSLVSDSGLGLAEIPTVAPPLQSVQEDIAAVAAQIRSANVTGVVTQLSGVLARLDTTLGNAGITAVREQLEATMGLLNETLTSVNHLVASADSTLSPIRTDVSVTAERLRASLDSLDVTMRAMRTAVDPSAPLSVQATESLRELGDAANAMRRLAEYLERNPSALVRGRAKEPQ